MKPQMLNLECEVFDEFREKLDASIKVVMKQLIRKGMQSGKISANIKIVLHEQVTDDGEVIYIPEIEPGVKIRIGAEGKVDCRKQEGFLMKASSDEEEFVIGTSQVSMDELMQEQEGA